MGTGPRQRAGIPAQPAFLAEAGLGPRDVDNVTMVIRCHPIRVAGRLRDANGRDHLEKIAADAGLPADHREFTTVTGRVRRVGHFDPELVKHAIQVNGPDRIVLNHLDYVDRYVRGGELTLKALQFVEWVETATGCSVDWLGTGPSAVLNRNDAFAQT